MSDAAADECQEPTPKKLRSAGEPDLKVFVAADEEEEGSIHTTKQATDGPNATNINNKEKPNKMQLFYYHSLTLATHSDYVDAMLASNMAESATKELHFLDISVSTWQRMLSFLEDPSASRRMTIEDAVRVLPFYDKYQFKKGKQLCAQVLSEFIQNMDDTADLDQLVDVVLVANSNPDNLEDTKKIGMDALVHRLSQTHLRILFTVRQIKKLVPLLAHEPRLLQAIRMPREHVLSPLFPQYLVQSYAAWQTRHTLQDAVTQCRMAVAGAGEFNVRLPKTKTPNHCCSFSCDYPVAVSLEGAQHMIFFMRQSNNSHRGAKGDWVVEGKVATQPGRYGEWTYSDLLLLWRCPQSSNYAIPPRTGWECVHDMVRGTELRLQIEYR